MKPVSLTQKYAANPYLQGDTFTLSKFADRVTINHLIRVGSVLSRYNHPYIRTVLQHIYEKHGEKIKVNWDELNDYIDVQRVITNEGVYEFFQILDTDVTQEMLEFYGVAYRPPPYPHYMDGVRDALNSIDHVAPFYINEYRYDVCYTELKIVIVDRAKITPGDHVEERIANTGFTLQIVDAENAYRVTAQIMQSNSVPFELRSHYTAR